MVILAHTHTHILGNPCYQRHQKTPRINVPFLTHTYTKLYWFNWIHTSTRSDTFIKHEPRELGKVKYKHTHTHRDRNTHIYIETYKYMLKKKTIYIYTLTNTLRHIHRHIRSQLHM